MTKKIVLGTITAIVTISLIAATFTFVQGQQANNPGQPFAQLEEQVQQILVIVGDPSSGNPEIKAEVSNIETIVEDPNFGLEEIKNEVSNIETVVTDPNFGLEEIKNEVSNIETVVTDPNFGLEEIKNEVSNIETILTAEGCPGCTFVYTVKYTCPNVGTLAGLINVPDGSITTVINVHNFKTSTVSFDVKGVKLKALGETPLAPSSKTTTSLLTDRGFYISCTEILTIVGAGPTGDGFIVIETEDELDVVAVYSGGGVKRSSGRALSFGMDVQVIEPHLVPPSSGHGGGA